MSFFLKRGTESVDLSQRFVVARVAVGNVIGGVEMGAFPLSGLADCAL